MKTERLTKEGCKFNISGLAIQSIWREGNETIAKAVEQYRDLLRGHPEIDSSGATLWRYLYSLTLDDDGNSNLWGVCFLLLAHELQEMKTS